MSAPARTVPDVSVVIPVHDEAATLRELVERVAAVFAAAGTSFEIVFVDDGSTDATPALLAELEDEVAHEMAAVRVVTLVRNFGQAAALCCGIFEARGEVVVTMDGDLQNPPEEIPRLLDALATPGVDVVTARRALRHGSIGRWLGSRMVHWIARVLVGVDIQDYGGQFKAYRRDVVDATRVAWAPGKPFFVLAAWLGFRVVEIDVRHEPRRVGQSRYDLASLVRVNVDLMTSFTTAPLLLLGVLAVASGTAGTVGLGWCWWTARPLGLAAGLSLLLLGAAAVFLAAAALGVYLARVYRTISGPPTGWVKRPPRTAGSAAPSDARTTSSAH
jgi:undecaprenyl-phosphate 4-deoxy-4-formamido-L-arabinose transferase